VNESLGSRANVVHFYLNKSKETETRVEQPESRKKSGFLVNCYKSVFVRVEDDMNFLEFVFPSVVCMRLINRQRCSTSSSARFD
jgi:hypothetical protein